MIRDAGADRDRGLLRASAAPRPRQPVSRKRRLAIDTHCLHLISAGAILVGAYVDGVMRAAAEIVPDRTARQAKAAITIEQGFDDRGFARMLTDRIIDEARRYHLNMLRVLEQSSITNIRLAGRHSLRRQRIRRLDHVRTAADRRARRKQHEARRP